MDKSQLPILDGLLQTFYGQESCDVFFLVEKKKIGAHKRVLQMQCQVLYEKAKDWTPSKQPIHVKRMSYKCFDAVLKYE